MYIAQQVSNVREKLRDIEKNAKECARCALKIKAQMMKENEDESKFIFSVSPTSFFRRSHCEGFITREKVSLKCCLSFSRIKEPIKGIRCAHAQSFDKKVISHLFSVSK